MVQAKTKDGDRGVRFSAAKTADKLLPQRMPLRIARSAIDFTMSRNRHVRASLRADMMALAIVPGSGMKKYSPAGHTV